jgi:acetate---CoA ligase (ADP-forming)
VVHDGNQRRDLDALFAPRSVAVLGASGTPGKWGYILAEGALAGEHRRPAYFVNRNGSTVLGRPAHRSLDDLPGAPDLVAIAVPAAGFEDAVDAALAAGARAIVAISAGLGESGAEGRARERKVVERIRRAGAVLLGPNCLGVADTHAELSLVWAGFRAGAVGLISQSGNVAIEIAELLAGSGLGISRFASLGNQADLDATDLLESFAADARTRLIALYVEDFRDGRRFARAARAAVAAGKPVVLLSAGRSAAGARAARSHTGALVSDTHAIDAACRAAGVIRTTTPKQLADAAQALLAGRPLRGPRIAVMGDGGGHNAIAADAASLAGLELPALSEALSGQIAAMLPAHASAANPIDFAGGGEQDAMTFAQVAGALLAGGEVDGVVLTGYFGGYGGEGELRAARELARIARESVAPLVVQTIYGDSAVAGALRDGGVPVYREIEAATGALEALRAQAAGPGPAIPPLPEPTGGAPSDGYWGARELVAAAGIAVIEGRRVRALEEAERAAGELQYPVALKAIGALHKSDAGGVVLDIPDADALRRAFAAVSDRLAPDELSVERMAPLGAGVELLVGTRRDPRFGPLVLVGVGGVHAEILRDFAVALAPVDAARARDLLLSLAGAALLTGARGRPPVDLAAAAEAIAALSRLGAARPDLEEIEMNPLLVTPDGAVALDARVISGA